MGHIRCSFGHADQAFAVAGHEVHVFCRAVLGCADEVPFIFTVRIVGDDDDMTGLQFFDSFFNGVEFTFFCRQNKDLLITKALRR